MELEKLIDEVKAPGTYEIKFNSSADKFGKLRNLPDGYYFYHLDAGEYFNDKKSLKQSQGHSCDCFFFKNFTISRMDILIRFDF